MTATSTTADVAELTGPLMKRCPDCGDVKPLTDFHRNPVRKDGRGTYCKPCANTQTRERQARKRAEMGDEAWLAYVRDSVRRSRHRRGSDTERQYNRAKRRALAKLAEMYPKAFDHLLAVELDAERRADR